MRPLALTNQQFGQLMSTSYTIPRPLRGNYLRRVARPPARAGLVAGSLTLERSKDRLSLVYPP